MVLGRHRAHGQGHGYAERFQISFRVAFPVLVRRMLDEHESGLREHLAKDRSHNAELHKLKRELAKQSTRGDEFSDQLPERPSILGGRLLVKRLADRTATAALPASAPGVPCG